jgi:tetratricopeptide (TPR) repeat protein
MIFLLETSEKHYHLAIEGYSKAIELDQGNAVYYSNGAFAHMKLEEYESAMADALVAIYVNPSHMKVMLRNRVWVLLRSVSIFTYSLITSVFLDFSLSTGLLSSSWCQLRHG